MITKYSAQEKVEEELHQKSAKTKHIKKENCVLYNASTVVPKFFRKYSLIRLPNILCKYMARLWIRIQNLNLVWTSKNGYPTVYQST